MSSPGLLNSPSGALIQITTRGRHDPIFKVVRSGSLEKKHVLNASHCNCAYIKRGLATRTEKNSLKYDLSESLLTE